MSDTLLGVIIGGIIAILGQSITLFINYLKWKKDKRIEYLQNKRQKLEVIFEKVNKEILKGIDQADYSMDIITDVLYLCPQIVVDAFSQFMDAKDKSRNIKMGNFNNIISAMKISISEIELEIEKFIL